MSKTQEALKLALKDLERSESAMHKARAIIREALAEQPASGLNPLWVVTHPDGLTTPQPAQQEPVATNKVYVTREQLAEIYPPASKPWVGLTDEEYSQLHDGFHQQGKLLGWVVDQVETKLREKNA